LCIVLLAEYASHQKWFYRPSVYRRLPILCNPVPRAPCWFSIDAGLALPVVVPPIREAIYKPEARHPPAVKEVRLDPWRGVRIDC
jgi:hypothetical protein